MKPIVIIHGWSDTSESFQRLAKKIESATQRPIEEVWLGDYESMDNDIKLKDVVTRMNKVWHQAGLPTQPNSVDVIVHSTGGLVIRLWMQRFYTDKNEKAPIDNLVMLAPANFGSPLAHKGRSLIGRVLKGHSSEKRFQTGTHILKNLELASPFTWELAQQDRFTETNPFNASSPLGGVRCSVIVGNFGYPGIKGIANEPGSDGTVYIATANLNCARLRIDVNAESGEITPGLVDTAKGSTAFLVLDRYDHSSITGNKGIKKKLIEPILRGLSVGHEDFAAWCSECDARTNTVMNKYKNRSNVAQHAYQNTVFRIRDDQGEDVTDYTIEFYGKFDDDTDKWALRFNRDISRKCHPYKDNEAYRSFMINVTRLYKEVDEIDEALQISLSAYPDFSEDGTSAGYKTFGTDEIGQITLNQASLTTFFQPNRTLLIDVVLPRYQADNVFRLKDIANINP
ncbi:MAG: triacylglycerol esterase/lipase EstA (alpha/beta hydrolase family) [Candidatus Azotimanducaceae bacterium]|jgi:triacylglycerol esterase/lipase EstA (alpha/beta hydrolase family)